MLDTYSAAHLLPKTLLYFFLLLVTNNIQNVLLENINYAPNGFHYDILHVYLMRFDLVLS